MSAAPGPHGGPTKLRPARVPAWCQTRAAFSPNHPCPRSLPQGPPREPFRGPNPGSGPDPAEGRPPSGSEKRVPGPPPGKNHNLARAVTIARPRRSPASRAPAGKTEPARRATAGVGLKSPGGPCPEADLANLAGSPPRKAPFGAGFPSGRLGPAALRQNVGRILCAHGTATTLGDAAPRQFPAPRRAPRKRGARLCG